MTAALYDVKAKLSEYITMAENGEVIEITKHGVATTVLISLKKYNELKEDYDERHQPSPWESLRKWRAKYADDLDFDFSEYLDKLRVEDRARSLEEQKNWRNPWD